MATTYSAFLQAPTTAQLAGDATLHYITTTTSISEPTAILKHLQAQKKLITTKDQKILNAIEGTDTLFLETELTLQFTNGGGAYLPSMDANLLDEKLVTFLVMHVVSFDDEQKIKQIRLHWDQGTLLKQVDAIGRTGRNWPIREGRAQIDLVSKSLKTEGVNPDKAMPMPKKNGNEVIIKDHHKRTSVSATRDPHASLNLFAPRDPNENTSSAYDGPKLAPRASAKPAPRDYGELFASGNDETASVSGSQARSPSPKKIDGTNLKAGAGRHYTGNRLFDDSGEGRAPNPARKKTYEQKYDHFSFGDGEDAPHKKHTGGASHHHGQGSQSQPTFSFEDFATPQKVKAKPRRDDQVQWGSEVRRLPPTTNAALTNSTAGGSTFAAHPSRGPRFAPRRRHPLHHRRPQLAGGAGGGAARPATVAPARTRHGPLPRSARGGELGRHRRHAQARPQHHQHRQDASRQRLCRPLRHDRRARPRREPRAPRQGPARAPLGVAVDYGWVS